MGSDLVDGSLLRGCSHWEWLHCLPKHSKTTLIYTVKLFTSQFATLTAIFLCLFWWWTHQNYIPLPTFTIIYSVNVVTDSMHVMACFFQGWPVSAGVNFHCIQPWSTKTGRNWHYQNWCRLVEMSSRAKAFTNCPNFKDSVHKDNWHIASYCCFIQTAPTLYGTYIKNEVRKMLCWQKAVEGLLFKEKLLNLRHRPLWDLCLDAKMYYLHRGTKSAPNQGCHANDWDAHHWNFKAAKLGGIHFGAVWEGINFGEPVLGT